jgi:hypothetical protein
MTQPKPGLPLPEPLPYKTRDEQLERLKLLRATYQTVGEYLMSAAYMRDSIRVQMLELSKLILDGLQQMETTDCAYQDAFNGDRLERIHNLQYATGIRAVP